MASKERLEWEQRGNKKKKKKETNEKKGWNINYIYTKSHDKGMVRKLIWPYGQFWTLN